MKIGIDASRAFVAQRTGIEEYAFQVIEHLSDKFDGNEVFLYVKKGQRELVEKLRSGEKGIKLPDAWVVKELPFEYFWTQLGLSWEMALQPVEVLFVPAHTIPWIYPQKTVVTVHGLEFEHCPQSYSFSSRFFHRVFLKMSCRWASDLIAVSQKTKKDLTELYKVPVKKVNVVYNGYSEKLQTTNYKLRNDDENDSKFLLYVGRLETRKNIINIIKAFESLKTKFNYQGKLVLAGNRGQGYDDIRTCLNDSAVRADIIEKGYVSDEEKRALMEKADAFLFPSLCEGFGIPILEAQSAGVPVITSNYGPMDEVAGSGAVLVDPQSVENIAEQTWQIIVDRQLRLKVIEAGFENIKRFSWDECAKQVADILLR
jgi:glycosyltransferase involved in cell wall biosynthesis